MRSGDSRFSPSSREAQAAIARTRRLKSKTDRVREQRREKRLRDIWTWIAILRRSGVPLITAQVAQHAGCSVRLIHYRKAQLRDAGRLNWRRGQRGLFYTIIRAPT